MIRTAWLLVLTGIVACGGSSEAPPGPLKHTIADMYIASVPVDAKAGVVSTKQEYDIAQMEQAKVESDLAEARTQIQVADNEVKAAELEVKSAATEKSAAEKSADLNKQEDVKRKSFAAEQKKKAAAAKLEWLRARRDYLEKNLLYRQHDSFAKEAAWQLEKARVARANNIRPSGFSYEAFESQATQRRDATARARQKAESMRGTMESREREYQQRASEAQGTPTQPSYQY
jgi:DNA repair exonuclease SbcCD ATPase subunit